MEPLIRKYLDGKLKTMQEFEHAFTLAQEGLWEAEEQERKQAIKLYQEICHDLQDHIDHWNSYGHPGNYYGE